MEVGWTERSSEGLQRVLQPCPILQVPWEPHLPQPLPGSLLVQVLSGQFSFGKSMNLSLSALRLTPLYSTSPSLDYILPGSYL